MVYNRGDTVLKKGTGRGEILRRDRKGNGDSEGEEREGWWGKESIRGIGEIRSASISAREENRRGRGGGFGAKRRNWIQTSIMGKGSKRGPGEKSDSKGKVDGGA